MAACGVFVAVLTLVGAISSATQIIAFTIALFKRQLDWQIR